MDIAKFSIKNKLLIYLLTLLGVAYGAIVYEKMGKLQDPEYTIKDALVITYYPGASAKEVEEEVSDKLEEAIQKLPYVKRIRTQNSMGKSLIIVTMKDQYNAKHLPQIWDELRKKIAQVTPSLPPRAKTPFINDDFGDVYGVLLAIYGDAYSYDELKDYIDFLKKELILVEGVGKLDTFGERQRALILEISRDKLANLGITKEQIAQELYLKNLVPYFGSVHIGEEFVAIQGEGIDRVDNLLDIALRGTQSNAQIFLRDIATLKDTYLEPATEILHYDGHLAIAIGISTIEGGNVVAMGKKIDEKLQELEHLKPLGIKMGIISHQAKDVEVAISTFMLNLIQAVAIVIVVLLLFMGLRSGLIIGAVLLVTIALSFIFMPPLGIMLERVSLGALIIALGMLVDNAIVVVDGILVRIGKGTSVEKAASETVKQTALPLLAATLVAILAFGAIGLSNDTTGEYMRSFFYVVFISLGLSWITAMTLTPVLAMHFLKPPKPKKERSKEQYDSFIYAGYSWALSWALGKPKTVVLLAVVLFGVALASFPLLQKSFFPNSSREQILVDYFFPQGSSIETTAAHMEKIAKQIQPIQGAQHITTFIGSGAPRFLLTYSPVYPNPAYAQMLIDVDDYKNAPRIIEEIEALVQTHYPNLIVFGTKFILGPSEGGRVQAKIFGKDPDKLRKYEEEVMRIIADSPYAKGVRSDWRNRIKVIKPLILDDKANLNGITKDGIATAILDTYEGRKIGVYRDQTELLPIILRAPQEEREDVKHLENIQIFSPFAQRSIPLSQLIHAYETRFEDGIIYNYNRKRAITIHAEPVLNVLPSQLLKDIKAKVEALPFEEGYYVEWHGEYKDSKDAQQPIMESLPLFAIAMVLIVIALFNSVKKTLIIWLSVPLSLIGVVGGLMLTQLPFGFMSLLGFLSLSGMLIKNAIVLIDEITLKNETQKMELYPAIFQSGLSRLRAVAMAALTTALGMLPLAFDPFFASMAVVIIFGLMVATLLTMILVPVLYWLFFRPTHA